jgi:hypothetical protein
MSGHSRWHHKSHRNLKPTPPAVLQGSTFDEMFDVLLSSGRPGAAAPFTTGEQLVTSSCLPYNPPNGVNEDYCSVVTSPTCSSLDLQGGCAG